MGLEVVEVSVLNCFRHCTKVDRRHERYAAALGLRGRLSKGSELYSLEFFNSTAQDTFVLQILRKSGVWLGRFGGTWQDS